jgi:hypothetical protein
MKLRIIIPIVSFCTVVALAMSVHLPAQAQQQSKLIEFDAPDAGTVFSSTAACQPSCGTQSLANNNVGAIVGYYTDANVVAHGFLRTPSGHITSFDAPEAGQGFGLDQGTVAYSINDLGVIAGLVQDSTSVYHGFVRSSDGSFTDFDAPGAGTGANQGTFAFNINLDGATAGVYVDASNVQHGFVRSRNGEITSFDPTGSIYTMVCEETCLNVEGAITGYYSDASGIIHGFLREPDGNFTTLDAPGAVQLTIGASINLEGAITGYFLDSSNVAHGFVRTREGNFTTFNVPTHTGVVETAAFSINLLGVVTGEFLDSSNVMHGFSRSRNGTFVTFDAPDAGTSAGQGTRPSTNNLSGAVTGWWVDGNGLNHGFVWYAGWALLPGANSGQYR